MARAGAKLKDLVILINTDVSRTVNSEEESWDADLIGIIAPASAEATEIEVSADAVTFVPLNDGTNDVAGPAASKAVEYDSFSFPYWRLKAPGGNVAATRTFKCYKTWNAW